MGRPVESDAVLQIRESSGSLRRFLDADLHHRLESKNRFPHLRTRPGGYELK
jgi:hypothetical protein